ncbi:MAG: DUF4349 domain-containing protein [Lachnospirales bacterium]
MILKTFKNILLPLWLCLMVFSACNMGTEEANSNSYGGEAVRETADVLQDDAIIELEQIEKIIKSSSIELEVNNLKTSIEEINVYLNSVNGTLEEMYWRNSSANIRIRVPEATFEKSNEYIQTLGDTIQISITNENVTKTYNLNTNYLTIKNAQLDRLNKLLEKEINISEKIELQKQIGEVEKSISLYNAKNELLNKDVGLSSIDIHLIDKSNIRVSSKNTASIFNKSLNFTAYIFKALLYYLGVFLPFAILIPIVLAPLVIIRKRKKL